MAEDRNRIVLKAGKTVKTRPRCQGPLSFEKAPTTYRRVSGGR